MIKPQLFTWVATKAGRAVPDGGHAHRPHMPWFWLLIGSLEETWRKSRRNLT
jgi:hypothetical protein